MLPSSSSSSTPAELPFSPSPTLVDSRRPISLSEYSKVRKLLLLLLFCLAQFLDAFNNSALFSAIPQIAAELHMTTSETVWLISAYQLTFAAFLLLSGRISDVYSPKWSFVAGTAALGVLSIIAGFMNNKVGLLVFRALCGIAGACTIPSALNLIVHLFPKHQEQSRALGIFGGTGAVANVLGLVIGAILTQYASWRWVFWFAAVIVIPVSGMCVFLIPKDAASGSEIIIENGVKVEKAKGLDAIGVSVLTAAMILFIFAITSGSSSGWATALVLAPLIISVFMMVFFFWYERRIPVEKAALPPRLWFYPNFAVLFGVALVPYFWWTTGFLLFTSLWQDVFGWQPIVSALHFLPIGLLALPAMPYAGSLSHMFGLKPTILSGFLLLCVATPPLAFASRPSLYFPLVIPGFLLGTLGCTILYANTGVAMFQATPPRMAGTVGAIFNSALQLGSAVGVAAVTSIETSIEAKVGSRSYKGRAASYWFLFAIVVLASFSVLVFFRHRDPKVVAVLESGEEAVVSGPQPESEAPITFQIEERPHHDPSRPGLTHQMTDGTLTPASESNEKKEDPNTEFNEKQEEVKTEAVSRDSPV
ncbi:MFS general substrate transporter [Sistotremastrum suecicum HHB10207 ss-3]|uniref:MFS general substrate transporter n=1 Tax=Sistotremastrum suecicum HHB10207 ss-3 TaxID=1314776 RepID=A0A166CZI0_9AGAM|nr:MFS general substrate transporter [Sistotremastrum suecicum HHB10207 ss-3]